jgi:uncharacterized protein
MKNVIILHGTDAKPEDNWFPWLKNELEADDWEVWVPHLPQANKPSIRRYNKFLLSQNEFHATEETVMIGHSAGAVAIMGLLQTLPEDVVIKRAVLVGAFKNDLGWESLKELIEDPLDFEKIKKHVKEITILHSDNDPYIPLEQAEYLAEKLDGELIILKGQKHFSKGEDPKYKQFPFVAELLREE